MKVGWHIPRTNAKDKILSDDVSGGSQQTWQRYEGREPSEAAILFTNSATRGRKRQSLSNLGYTNQTTMQLSPGFLVLLCNFRFFSVCLSKSCAALLCSEWFQNVWHEGWKLTNRCS